MSAARLLSTLMVALLLASSAPAGLSQLRPAEPMPEKQVAPPWRNTLPDEPVAPEAPSAQEPAETRAFHDPANPDLRLLQPSDEGLAGLPRDARGAPDWVRALREGRITPRNDLRGAGTPQVLDLDIILKNTRDMPYVRFPHRAHTEWLACSNCHDQIFVPQAGANPMNMEKIFRGQYCGVCHDRVAFVTHQACERCHNVAHGDMQRWW